MEKDMEETENKIIRKNIAYVSPFPPINSGIADYSEDVVVNMVKYMNIDIYYDEKLIDKITGKITNLDQQISVFPLTILYTNKDKYDFIIYNIGNNYKYHGTILKMALMIPGIVILHDFKIGDMMYYFNNIDDYGYYKNILEFGNKFDDSYEKIKNSGIITSNDIQNYTFNEYLIYRSHAVITHTKWAYTNIFKKYKYTDVFYVPMGHHGGTINYKPQIKKSKKTEINKKIKIGVFGNMNKNRRIDKILYAIGKLIDKKITKIHLYLVGNYNKNDFDPHILVNELKLEEYVTIETNTDINRFNSLIEEMDIGICLRYPTMGESSGIMVKLIYAGKPCIISDVDQYKFFPDDFTIKIKVNEYDIDNDNNTEINAISFAIRKLVINKKLRRIMSEKAYKYGQENYDMKNMIKRFVQIIYTTNKNNSLEIFPQDKLRNDTGFPHNVYETYVKIDNIYRNYLGRNASFDELKHIENHLNTDVITLEKLEQGVSNSNEHKEYEIGKDKESHDRINKLYLTYLNRQVDISGYKHYRKIPSEIVIKNLVESNEAQISKKIHDLYREKLFRECDETGLKSCRDAITSGRLNYDMLGKILESSEEHKQRSHIGKFIIERQNELIQNNFDVKKRSDLLKNVNIKFMSVLGTSGYAIAGLDYLYALYINGANITYDFCYVENLVMAETNDKFNVQIKCYKKDIKYDYVIIHCMPDHFKMTAIHEKYISNKTKIYGLFAWETDTLPISFIVNLPYIDEIIVPSVYNKLATEKATDKKIHVIEHVIESTRPTKLIEKIDQTNQTNQINQFDDRVNDDDYMFLIVSQWNLRKRIEDTIKCYLSTFTKNDKVVLYIKTFHNKRELLNELIDDIIKKYGINAPKVVVNMDHLDDTGMHKLYDRCNCFLSLCYSEGVGLGACYTAYLGKSVIITGCGGQVDYLKNGLFVDYTLVDIDPCNKIYPDINNKLEDHTKCPPGEMRCLYNYFTGNMKWGKADLKHASKLMQFVVNNRDEANNIAKSNSEFIKENFSYDAIARKFYDVFNGK